MAGCAFRRLDFRNYLRGAFADGIAGKIINAIPPELKLAVGAGIGLFITFVGLQGSGIIEANSSTLVSIGNIHSGPVLLTVFGVIVTVILMVLRVNGGVFIGMLLTAVAGMICGLIPVPTHCRQRAESCADFRTGVDAPSGYLLRTNADCHFNFPVRRIFRYGRYAGSCSDTGRTDEGKQTSARGKSASGRFNINRYRSRARYVYNDFLC